MDRVPINSVDMMAMQDITDEGVVDNDDDKKMKTETTTTTLKKPRAPNPRSLDLQDAVLARLFQTPLSSNDQPLADTYPISASPEQGRILTNLEALEYGAALNEWPFPNAVDSSAPLDADMTWTIDDPQVSPFGPNGAASATDPYQYPELSTTESLPTWASQAATTSPSNATFAATAASASGTPITSPGSQLSGCEDMLEAFRSALDDSAVQPINLSLPNPSNIESVSDRRTRTPRSSIDTGRRLSHGQATHVRPSEKKPIKRGHNVVEKRYRTNLNDKLERLRERIPSLCQNGPAAAAAAGGSEEGRKSNHNRPNKANILEKAVEYIQQLEGGLKQTSDENTRLRVRLRALEKIVLDGDEARSHLGALLDTTM